MKRISIAGALLLLLLAVYVGSAVPLDTWLFRHREGGVPGWLDKAHAPLWWLRQHSAAAQRFFVWQQQREGEMQFRLDGGFSVLYRSPKGVPTHADYYDDKRRVRHTVYYREDGTPGSAKEFDERGKVVLEQELDPDGNVTKETKPQ